jgi:hypothetical protein
MEAMDTAVDKMRWICLLIMPLDILVLINRICSIRPV